MISLMTIPQQATTTSSALLMPQILMMLALSLQLR
ncbi:Uncharacterised protein [Vibrio cholerae]|nr:Uncharacterised protein [Vibrio cholerae]